MKTKQEILDFANRCGMTDEEKKRLSTLLDSYRAEIVGSVPCKKREVLDFEMLYVHDRAQGYNQHVAEVEAWKQKQGKEVEG